MSFAWPLALLGLGVVALALVAYLVASAAADALRRPLHEPRPAGERRRRLAALAPARAGGPHPARPGALVVGIARPAGGSRCPAEQATVILTIDISGSMTATDVAPDRMTAAREAASSFVEGLPSGFKVGVVSFSNEVDVVVPPTSDHDAALAA